MRRKNPDPQEIEMPNFPVMDPIAQVSSLDLFSGASPDALNNLKLMRMNSVANLRKQIALLHQELALLMNEVAEQLADVKVAELILKQRSEGNAGSR